MFGYRRRRSPLLWRMLKTAAAVGGVYMLVRTPYAEARREKWASQGRAKLKANAERALRMKMGRPKPWRPESQTADEGMRSIPNEGLAPSGALHAEGFKPAFERGGKAR